MKTSCIIILLGLLACKKVEPESTGLYRWSHSQTTIPPRVEESSMRLSTEQDAVFELLVRRSGRSKFLRNGEMVSEFSFKELDPHFINGRLYTTIERELLFDHYSAEVQHCFTSIPSNSEVLSKYVGTYVGTLSTNAYSSGSLFFLGPNPLNDTVVTDTAIIRIFDEGNTCLLELVIRNRTVQYGLNKDETDLLQTHPACYGSLTADDGTMRYWSDGVCNDGVPLPVYFSFEGTRID